jgi:cobalt/nickel transport protein
MRKMTGFLLAGLFVALLLAGVASNFASSSPDGLDATSYRGCTLDDAGEITGGNCIAQGAKDHEVAGSPLADYGIAGLDNPYLSTGLSGVLGVLVTFGLAGGVFWLARARRGAADATSAPAPAHAKAAAGQAVGAE